MPSKTVFAIVAITAIIICCIFNDINGVVVASGTAAIAGLGGYAVGKKGH